MLTQGLAQPCFVVNLMGLAQSPVAHARCAFAFANTEPHNEGDRSMKSITSAFFAALALGAALGGCATGGSGAGWTTLVD